MLTPLLLLLQAAATPTTPPVASGTIVVTGRRLADTDKTLKDCIRRKCPPLEDMAATIAHAENLFVAGNYTSARLVLKGSIGRNGKFAPRYPREVSSLYRAGALLSSHVGEGDDYRKYSYATARALKAGLPADGREVLLAEVEASIVAAKLGDHVSAETEMRFIADRAARAGQPDIAAVARLRLAGLMQVSYEGEGAKALYRTLAADPDPKTAAVATMAKVQLARMEHPKGDPAMVDALLADIRSRPGRAPVLLYAPEIKADLTGANRGAQGGDTLNQVATEDYGKQWADLGFRVTADGKVEDLEVLRSKGNGEWLKPVLESIEGRRYAPFADGETGSYRIERFTYTSWLQTIVGTHIQSHAPGGRIERVDLTVEPAPPPVTGPVATAKP